MPVYTYTDEQTKTTVKLEGDSPPTEAELETIFSQDYLKNNAPKFQDTTKTVSNPIRETRPEPGLQTSTGFPTAQGGPRAPLASFSEAAVEPLEELNNPRITTPKLDIKPTDSLPMAVGKEVVNIASSIPEFFSSTAGALSAVAGAGLPRAIAGGFSAQMTYETGKNLLNIIPNWNKLSREEKVKAVVDTGANALFATGAGLGAAGVHILAPKTEAALTPEQEKAAALGGLPIRETVPSPPNRVVNTDFAPMTTAAAETTKSVAPTPDGDLAKGFTEVTEPRQPKIEIADLSKSKAIGGYEPATGRVMLDKAEIEKLSPEERSAVVRHELAHKIESESELWMKSDDFLWRLWETDKRHPIWDFMSSTTGKWNFDNAQSPEIIAELYAKHYPKGTFTVTDRPNPYEHEGENFELPREYLIPEPLMEVLNSIEDKLGIWTKKKARQTAQTKGETPNASSIGQTTEVHGNVPAQPVKGEGEVSTEKGSEGVRTQGSQENEPQVVTLPDGATLTLTEAGGRQAERDVTWNQLTSKETAKEGTFPVSTEELGVGSKVKVGGKEMKVIKRDEENGALFLRGAYGEQVLSEGSELYVESHTPPEVEGTTQFQDLGGAVYGSEGAGEGGHTSLMFAAIEEDLKKRGKPPMGPTLRVGWDEQMAKAKAAIDRNPQWAPELVEHLQKDPRPIETWEHAGLVWYNAELQARLNGALDEIGTAFRDNKPDQLLDAQIRQRNLEDKIDQLEKVTGRNGTGSEAGRRLQAQKMGLTHDYSLVEMNLRLQGIERDTPGGVHKPAGSSLDPDEVAQIKKDFEDIKAAKETAERGEAEARKAQVEAELARHKAEKELADRPRLDKRVVEYARKLVDRMDKAADEAGLAMDKLLGRTRLGPIDVELLKQGSIYIAGKVLKHTWDYAAAKAHMLDRWGEAIRTYIPDIWDRAQALITKQTSGQPESVKKVLQKDKPAEERKTDATESIRTKVKQNKLNEITSDLNKLVRSIVDQKKDITADELVDQVHGILKEMVPAITRDDTMDAISGYGKYTPLSKDETTSIVRDLRGQMQQTAKIRDYKAKGSAEKTGVQRRIPSDIERNLIKLVNEAKRRFGINVTDTETQLKSSLDARKTYYRNQIADLDHEIQTRQKIVKDKTAPPQDEELKSLIAERDRLKKDHEAIFGKKGISDQQRLKMAIASVDRSAAEYDRMIKASETRRPERGGKTPKDPRLDAAKAHRDALKAEWNHLRDLDAALQEDLQTKKLQNSINEYDRRLREGDYFSAPKPEKATTPALESLRNTRNALRERLVEAARNSPEAARQALALAVKHGEELQRKINEGDVARRASPKRPVDPELEKQRAENRELNGIIQQLRRASERVVRDPREMALSAYEARATRRLAELERKIAQGDFSVKKREPLVLDRKRQELQAKVIDAQQRFDDRLKKFQLQNRTGWEKSMDSIVAGRRAFVLSNLTVIPKLISSALQIMAFTPIEDALGAVYKRIAGNTQLGQILQRADVEAESPTFKAMAKGMSAATDQLFKKSWDFLKTGRTEIDALYGHPFESYTGEMELVGKAFIIPGRIHGMIKAPVKRAAFEYKKAQLEARAIRLGENPADELTASRIALEAYKYANESIFLGDVRILNAFSRGMAYLESINKETGRPDPFAKAAATGLRTAVPITKVPTNVVKNILQYALGLEYAGVRVLERSVREAMGKQVEELTPEAANLIARSLKKGSIGTAVLLLGYFNRQNIGGFYQHVKKQDPSRPKPMTIRTPLGDLPPQVLHHPLLLTYQAGATAGLVADSYLRKKDPYPQGLGRGAFAAALGVTEEVPFIREMLEVDKLYNPYTRGQFMEDQLKSMMIPGLLQNIAEHTDPIRLWGNTTPRKPENFGQTLETGIPGLRQNVPIDYKKQAQQSR